MGPASDELTVCSIFLKHGVAFSEEFGMIPQAANDGLRSGNARITTRMEGSLIVVL